MSTSTLRRIASRAVFLTTAAGAIAFTAPALASNVLVENVGATWGFDESADMANVFGANYTNTDYASLDAASVFSGANTFVFLEGGDSSTNELSDLIATNGTLINNWVNAGGHLLIQSATNQGISISGVGPGTLNAPGYLTSSGTLTADGITAFTFEPVVPTAIGNYLAHDTITGSGLTTFMTNDGTGQAIVAGANVGTGYVMYSALTTPNFHSPGAPLTDDIISYSATAGGVSPAVPEPASWAMMIGGVGVAGGSLRRMRRSGAKGIIPALA